MACTGYAGLQGRWELAREGAHTAGAPVPALPRPTLPCPARPQKARPPVEAGEGQRPTPCRGPAEAEGHLQVAGEWRRGAGARAQPLRPRRPGPVPGRGDLLGRASVPEAPATSTSEGPSPARPGRARCPASPAAEPEPWHVLEAEASRLRRTSHALDRCGAGPLLAGPGPENVDFKNPRRQPRQPAWSGWVCGERDGTSDSLLVRSRSKDSPSPSLHPPGSWLVPGLVVGPSRPRVPSRACPGGSGVLLGTSPPLSTQVRGPCPSRQPRP